MSFLFLKWKNCQMANLSQYKIALGDSVSFGLSSDLFTIKSDFQANIGSCLYLDDSF